MTKYELAEKMALALQERYPVASCSLEYDGEPWKLLIMARLSAQCTDARVNIVSKELFSIYPTLSAVAESDLDLLEKVVRPCGLGAMKAKNIKEAAQILVRDFNGQVPHTMEDLLSLPGVGRKIANLILGDVFDSPGIVADTHCIRICGRLGFYPETEKNPAKVEKILDKYVKKQSQSDFCHRIVLFGREICTARAPHCSNCPASDFCKHNATLNKTQK